MSDWFTRVVLSSAAALFTLPTAVDAGEIQLLRGQLVAESHAEFRGLWVTLEDMVNHLDLGRVDVRPDGSFDLHRVPTGEYLLRVTNDTRQTVYTKIVTIIDHVTELKVELTEIRERSPAPGAGTISFRQLSHPPDKKAVQAFAAAERLSSAGKYQEAAAELEKAIRISPEFAGAYTNLAVQQIRLSRFEEGAASAQRAMEIGGADAVDLCNLAYAQFQLRRFEESAASAAAALRIDPGSLQAHLILGSVLANVPERRAEAIAHLKLAAEKFQSAKSTLEQLRKLR